MGKMVSGTQHAINMTRMRKNDIVFLTTNNTYSNVIGFYIHIINNTITLSYYL